MARAAPELRRVAARLGYKVGVCSFESSPRWDGALSAGENTMLKPWPMLKTQQRLLQLPTPGGFAPAPRRSWAGPVAFSAYSARLMSRTSGGLGDVGAAGDQGLSACVACVDTVTFESSKVTRLYETGRGDETTTRNVTLSWQAAESLPWHHACLRSNS